MMTVYCRRNDAVVALTLSVADEIPKDVVWIDMQSPTQEEELSAERQLGIAIPSKEEVWKNQVLNRMFREKGNAFMTAALITKIDSPYPQTSAVTFILTPLYLLTMRQIAPTSFQSFATRIQRTPAQFPTSQHILEGLIEEIITRVAYNSEMVVDTLDKLSHTIFNLDELVKHRKNPSEMMKKVLADLGRAADLNSKINESLHSIMRMVGFFKQDMLNAEVDAAVNVLITDTIALTKQTAFLSDKITFQLDATLGMINVEQNLIIKIFSVATVFFLPPTLISSMYGMNFNEMPELSWAYGYPMAVGMMVGCAAIPFFYFRKKGWM